MKIGTLCYLQHGSRTLMLLRNKKKQDIHEGRWVGLGGKIEVGESPEECVIREVYEESGLQLRNPVLRGVMTFPNFDGCNDWYVFLYTGDDFSGMLKECDEGTLEWISTDKLLDLNLWEGDRHFLKWIQEDSPMFSAKFEYEDNKLIYYNKTTY